MAKVERETGMTKVENFQVTRRATSLKYAIPAAYVARGWSVVMGLAFMPVYIGLMGAEAFGLVGLYVTLQAVFSLLDAGLGSKLNRDFAQFSAVSSEGQAFRDLLWTLEIPLWTAATVGGAAILAIGPTVANQWLNVETLSPRAVSVSLRLMGLILLFQLPMSFYAGGLMGLQRQMLASVLNAVWYTLRFAGGALAVSLVAPTPEVFFTWQLAVTVLSTACTAITLRCCLPAGRRRPKLSWRLLVSSWRFTTGLGAISVTVLALNQADKLILSKLISLKEFGYYALAWTVANGLRSLADPMFSVLFPRLSYLVSKGDQRQLAATYHAGCQLMTVVLVPLGAFLAFFAPEIMFLWTRDSTMVQQTHLLVALLSVGNMLLGLIVLPYALQLAHGWTSLNLVTNIVFIVLLVPLLSGLAPWYGATAAAWLWLLLNVGYVCVHVPIMHRRLFPRELWRWYAADIAMSAVPAILVLGAARMVLGIQLAPAMMALALGGTFVAAQLAALLASPLFWAWSERYRKTGWSLWRKSMIDCGGVRGSE
ncbi:MAG TPA: oligosaccharide flippase family protein [Thermoguttaceae bacterium]|nr:oligosaccharide flippase family protein [Thermoguttaceae bacterium]